MNNVRPERLLPGFEIYSKAADGKYTQHSPSTITGVPLKNSIDSALVPLSQKYLFVKLPSHRVFVRQGYKLVQQTNPRMRDRKFKNRLTTFNEITGMASLPVIDRLDKVRQAYMSNTAVIELDLASIGSNDCYQFDKDINTKVIPPGGYLLAGQLVFVRGADVTSVVYIELDSSTTRKRYPVLRKIGDLHGSNALLEQAYQDIQRTRATKNHVTYPGSQVLRVASTINFSNQYLVASKQT